MAVSLYHWYQSLKCYFSNIRDHTVIHKVHKKWLIFWPTPHLQNWTIDLLFKINRIHKHVINFKTYSSPFCVDVVNVWSFIGNNFKKKVMERLETLFKSFVSLCDTIFYLFHKKNMIRIKKQNALYDWDVF